MINVNIINALSRKILFGGYYGQRNVGDDCFGVISTWGARKYWKSEQIYLLSSEKLESILETNSCLSDKAIYRGQWLLEPIWQIIKSSCIIWSGGSTFHSKEAIYSPEYFSTITSMIGLTPTGAIGVSLGPYKNKFNQKEVYKRLHRLKFLALRDNASYEEAMSIGLPYKPTLSADLAMLLPEIVPNIKRLDNNKIIGITACHYERYTGGNINNEKRRENILIEGLYKLINRGYDGIFRVFIFNSNCQYGDQELTERIYDRLNNKAVVEIVPYCADPIYIWKKISECTAMISTRLHGGIFAAAANVPCLQIEYHKKCTEFIHDVGIDEKWKIKDLDCSSDELSITLINLLESNHQKFYIKREHLIELSKKNFTFVCE